MSAGRYSVGFDLGDGTDPNPSHADIDPYWIIAIISQGTILSYSRKTASSISQNLANDSVLNTQAPLIISDDCLSISVSNSKRTPESNFQATLKQADINYLTNIYPGDYMFAWMVNNRDKYLDLLKRLKNLQPCNKASDGLKFIGRVQDVRKSLNIESNVGHKNISYSLTGTGFSELQTFFFYDFSLASSDSQEQSLGAWLARLGVDTETLFGNNATTGIKTNNINDIIPTLLNLIIGSGPSHDANISADPFSGGDVSSTPTLANEAPYAYVIPLTVGKLLKSQIVIQPGKPRNVLAYADILELIMGLQVYSQKSGLNIFAPDLDPSKSTSGRKVTTKPMLGTFLPYMPEFCNIPLWDLFQKYLNPTINEIYATLRINSDGNIMPTIICRQIPFTTEAFNDGSHDNSIDSFEHPVQVEGASLDPGPLNVTKFLDLPRWLIPNSMIQNVDIGRSNVMRKNFIHIYATTALSANNAAMNEQIINNPPIRDDLDIMRNGMQPMMQTVETYTGDTVGSVQSSWMRLVADWSIGGFLTLSGSMQCFGIQSAIAVGDNVEFDGVVYHIEGISHSCSIDPMGNKQFRTSLQFTNGMRADGEVDSLSSTLQPIYAGVKDGDQRNLDPGLSLEGNRTSRADETALQREPLEINTFDPFLDQKQDISDLL